MEQIIFLALIAVVGLLRWLAQAAEEKKNKEAAKRTAPKKPNAPVERAPAESEEERIRRFMEALGVPTASAPPQTPPREVKPPPPQKRPEPKRKYLPVDPFPVPPTSVPQPPVISTPPPPVVIPPPEPPPRVTRTPAAPVITPPAPPPPQRTSAAFEVAEIEWQSDETPQPSSSTSADPLVKQAVVEVPQRTWASRLAQPESLRDAIVLREIFGGPRSMQANDERPFG